MARSKKSAENIKKIKDEIAGDEGNKPRPANDGGISDEIVNAGEKKPFP